MKIFNSKLTEACSQIFNLKGEESPPYAFDEIIPTVDIIPFTDTSIILGGDASGTQTTTLDVTKGDFIIKTAVLNMIKDAANDCAESYILIPTRGGQLYLNVWGMFSQAVQGQGDKVINTNIRVPKGSTLQWVATYGAGAMKRRAILLGYYE
jgi:hypothetical protein